ncbi:hypothetical protein AMECASPLE_018550 [Ameca splendens]|uniref:Uncharacterized protein n=1 Tax=Ameca splendens TaxID=208324 RepID=A0ABV0XFZ8_9TELE
MEETFWLLSYSGVTTASQYDLHTDLAEFLCWMPYLTQLSIIPGSAISKTWTYPATPRGTPDAPRISSHIYRGVCRLVCRCLLPPLIPQQVSTTYLVSSQGVTCRCDLTAGVH